jgi:acetylornithine deacetylase/succinyl-diaminopimelate desuccinylase-like protein
MNEAPTPAIAYAREHRRQSLTELEEFVRFPSVSTQPRHTDDVGRCAQWLASHLRRIGLRNVAVIDTPRHPIVYAAWRGPRLGPTVLIYGH